MNTTVESPFPTKVGMYPAPRAGVYKGPTSLETHSRSIITIDTMLQNQDWEGRIVSFDSLLLEQMEAQRSRGKNQATLVDIGSGDAGLFNDFINNSYSAIRSRRFLSLHPNFKLRLIGITDSPSPEQHNTIKPPEYKDKQVVAQNIYWSLTGAQTLEDFFNANGIDEVNLALAVHSMRYLSVPTFKRSVEAVTKRLSVGGRFVGIAINGNEPAFPDPTRPSFAVGKISANPELWKKIMHETSDPSWADPELIFPTVEEGEEAFDKIISTYRRLGVFTKKELKREMEEADAEIAEYYSHETDEAKLNLKIKIVLSAGAHKLRGMYQRRMNSEKINYMHSLDPLHFRVKTFPDRDGTSFSVRRIT